MNREMAYLLGMICGNGEIRRGAGETTVSIFIPHRKLVTESDGDVLVYVRASITDIRDVLEPLIGTGMRFTQQRKCSILSFTKPNDEYLMREILRYVGSAASHENIRIDDEVFSFTHDQKISFLQGFADVTGYIRRSNYCFEKYKHRVYLEVPHNWYLVVDICRLLRDVDIPVQAIDWAHPNMRDGHLKKYNAGQEQFWKKEHQIKIWANEFLPVGFAVLHKKEALAAFARELTDGIRAEGRVPEEVTHQYYWQTPGRGKYKPPHPGEDDPFIPPEIRGRHYNSWKQIAEDLGYRE